MDVASSETPHGTTSVCAARNDGAKPSCSGRRRTALLCPVHLGSDRCSKNCSMQKGLIRRLDSMVGNLPMLLVWLAASWTLAILARMFYREDFTSKPLRRTHPKRLIKIHPRHWERAPVQSRHAYQGLDRRGDIHPLRACVVGGLARTGATCGRVSSFMAFSIRPVDPHLSGTTSMKERPSSSPLPKRLLASRFR